MTTIETRLERRILRDFPEPDAAQEVMRVLADLPRLLEKDPRWFVGSPSGNERVQAAIVLRAEGDLERFHSAIDLCLEDWRDALVVAGLGHEDWQTRLDQELGPVLPSS